MVKLISTDYIKPQQFSILEGAKFQTIWWESYSTDNKRLNLSKHNIICHFHVPYPHSCLPEYWINSSRSIDENKNPDLLWLIILINKFVSKEEAKVISTREESLCGRCILMHSKCHKALPYVSGSIGVAGIRLRPILLTIEKHFK